MGNDGMNAIMPQTAVKTYQQMQLLGVRRVPVKPTIVHRKGPDEKGKGRFIDTYA